MLPLRSIRPPVASANDNLNPEIERHVLLWRQILAEPPFPAKKPQAPSNSHISATFPAQQ
jgi:hypothetical protein